MSIALVIWIFLASVLIPANASRFTLEAGRGPIVFKKMSAGLWHMNIRGKSITIPVRVRGTKVTLGEGSDVRTVNIANHLDVGPAHRINWKTATGITCKGKPCIIIRREKNKIMVSNPDARGKWIAVSWTK